MTSSKSTSGCATNLPVGWYTYYVAASWINDDVKTSLALHLPRGLVWVWIRSTASQVSAVCQEPVLRIGRGVLAVRIAALGTVCRWLTR